MLLLLVFILTVVVVVAATATTTITTTTTAAAAVAVATRTRKRAEAIFSGNGHDDDDHDEADGVVQTKLYSFRLDCSIVSLTAANTNLIFSVSERIWGFLRGRNLTKLTDVLNISIQ